MSTNKSDFLQRNEAIDILRAFTMLLMIFVNDFWTVKGVPKWLQHAKGGEDFLGLADAIFPVFLFVVGLSIPFAIERRFSKGFSGLGTAAHILTRSFALLIMGAFTVNTESGISGDAGMSMSVFRILMVAAFFMIWNVYPKTENRIRYLYTALQVIGVLILAYLIYIYRDPKDGYFRAGWWGILGTIGWIYLICATIYLFVRDKIPQIFFIWVGFVILCMVKSGDLIPRGHFINDMLSALNIRLTGHLVLTMGGVLFSLAMVKYSHVIAWKKVMIIVGAVSVFLIATAISHKFWIFSKNRATPTCVFACIAAAIAFYGLFQWAVAKGKASWFNIIKPAGTATLTCYVIPYVLYSVIRLTKFTLPGWMMEGGAGLIKCALYAFLCIGVAALLGKLKIKLKV